MNIEQYYKRIYINYTQQQKKLHYSILWQELCYQKEIYATLTY